MADTKKVVAAGMSGGVDSSLAAALLQQQGHTVIGITMEIYGGENVGATAAGHACYGPGEREDTNQARAVADFLGIPHHTLDLKDEYRRSVIGYFTAEYLAGKTPNPCTRCNPLMKFGVMLDRARQAGLRFDRFATGHYVRVCPIGGSGRHILKRARDLRKDQSYFLYGLRPEQLPGILFPLGELTKDEVRRQAGEMNLPVSDRPESQDFIEGGDYSCLFGDQQIAHGDIVDLSGRKLGSHQGIIYYTIGQRRGLGLSHSEPLYVVDINPRDNTVVVGPRQHLYARTLIAGRINWLYRNGLDTSGRVQAKIRHNHSAAPALFEQLEDGRARIVFDEPQLAITPGQSVVLYHDDVVLGGGIIEQRS